MRISALFLAACLLIIPATVTAQCGKKQFYGKAGVTFSSFGDNTVFRFNELDGAASFSGTGFQSFGINYVAGLNRWLESETGIEYSSHRLLMTPPFNPEFDNTPVEAGLSMITVPITLRANFLRYLFVNGGLLLGLDASPESRVDSQTGIGAVLGLGLKYDFRSGASVFFNPYSRLYSLLPFSAVDYPQRASENGFRIGFAWDLEKL
jgi:hypothetical protein